jgi:hypothetical protein
MCGTCPAPDRVLTSALSIACASRAMTFEKKGGL